MIIFDLICEHEHRFEGWFRDALAFETQLATHMVRCPQCDSSEVRKLPSAVAISTRRSEELQLTETPPSRTSAPVTRSQVLSLYKQLTEAVAAMSEDVGAGFAEEARKMHYNEIPERPIRGQTTDEEFEELQDEGIAVLRLPMIKEEDLN